IADRRLEAKTVLDILLAVAVVVDVDGVEDVVAEGREVRPARGLFERDEVGDDGDRVGPVGADEGVEVRVVRVGVLADEGRLAVARITDALPALFLRRRFRRRHGPNEACTGGHGRPRYPLVPSDVVRVRGFSALPRVAGACVCQTTAPPGAAPALTPRRGRGP